MININGTLIGKHIRESVQQQIKKTGMRPGLSVILVGNNPSSHVYVNIKEKAAQDAGIRFNKYIYDENTPEEDILTQIRILNYDDNVHGILVQLPLPTHLNQYKIISTIEPTKDVDGFHPANIHAFLKNEPGQKPVLVRTIDSLLKETGQNLAGKYAVILANSTIFADPTRLLLEQLGCTVELFAPTPTNIPDETKQADILICALGRPHVINHTHIKPGAIIIDIGITKIDGKIRGDVDRSGCENIPGFITPVPGGVGPVTVAQLIQATFEAAKEKISSYENNTSFGI